MKKGQAYTLVVWKDGEWELSRKRRWQPRWMPIAHVFGFRTTRNAEELVEELTDNGHRKLQAMIAYVQEVAYCSQF